MEIERPHRSSNNNSSSTTSELFICFTSRLSSSSSSSSMKISSKSILSPGRAREPTSQISLSTSLSRRLRSNGSLKGGQASPMFPAQGQGKKRGAAFENPEPSSPKVTCIGQVRVKTKKQGRKMRTRSKRRSGEISFRRAESGNNSHVELMNQPPSSQQQQPQQAEHRNQRWVHLPMTICEALRALGTDLNCFLPCRSPCMAGNQKEKEEKVASGGGSGGNNNGCGAVFARWLVSVQDGEGKGREIELVVGGAEEEEEEEVEERRRSYRRHVFEEIEFKEEEMIKEEARVSICVPPKNALLLMRCRSDPVRMAALSNKFWEPPLVPNEAEEEEEEAEEEENRKVEVNAEQGKGSGTAVQEIVGSSTQSAEAEIEAEQKLIRENSIEEFEEAQEIDTTEIVNLEDVDGEEDIVQKRNSTVGCGGEDLVEQEIEQEKEIEQEDDKPKSETEQEVEGRFSGGDDGAFEESSVSVQVQEDDQESEFLPAGQDLDEKEEELTVEQESKEEMQETIAAAKAEAEAETEEEETTTHERSELDDPRNQEGQMGYRIKESTGSSQPLLPDCLLLMMCEPKLSMEVSKETWVCSTDFIRSLPHHHSKPVKQKQAPSDEPKKKRNSIDCDPAPHRNKTLLLQPARSSCSYPARPPRAGGTESMSNMIEKKLVGAKAAAAAGYEPLKLKRCKSEPMRTAAKLGAGEPCFWKNRKLEPHRAATVGVGAAGVGVGV